MITAITLQGFKSFADKVRVEFDPGITAVIGPNGSGKSNVVEAIRWATHHARARELRAARATELVFHGSGGRAPLGFAEVTLELRNLPGAPRLNLARRVYRDGTTEQDLEGRAARVRDVQQALRGSGLGPGGLAVIGQGEVSSVVQAEPRTLLGYLEEAANLSRLATARDETRARLVEAGDALVTLRLLEDELSARVTRLGVDANAARRARELTLRSLTLRDALHRARQEALHQEIETLRTRESELIAESARVADDVRAAQDRQESLRDELARAAAQRSAHRQALELLGAARDASRQAEAYLGHLTSEVARLQAERAALDTAAPALPALDVASVEARLREARRSAEALEQEARRAEVDVNRALQEQTRRAEGAARRDAERSTLSEELARADERVTLAEQQLAAVTAEFEAARAIRAEREAEFARVASAREEQRSALRAARSERQALEAGAAPLTRELQRLEQYLASYARYGEGARNALRSGLPGVVGAVADLLRVPGDYETAVTAALGRRLEQVVVEDADVARRIIEHLKRVGGRATFLPLDLLRLRSRRDGPLLREAGVIGNLADLCPSDPPIVANNLLSDTLLVEDMRAATRLARAYPSRPRLVTVDGEVLEPGGALTGGRLRDSGVSHLGDQRRLAELHEELASSAERVTALGQVVSRVEGELTALDGRYDAALRAREEAARAERERERRLNEARAAVRGGLEARDALAARLSASPVAVAAPGGDGDAPDVAALQARLEDVRARARAARETEREVQDALSGARELALAWRAHEGAVARAAALDARLAELREAVLAQEGRVADAQAEAMRRAADLGEFDEGEYDRLEAARAAASQAYANLLGRQNKLRAQLEEVRLTVARREAAVEDVPPGALPAGAVRDWQAELTRVQRELSELGVVNARAEAEYEEERARLDGMISERSDAERASAELSEALGELERNAQSQLSAAFGRVERAFVEYARELLGGEGELVAERDDRGFLVGVRLGVQPRGKRTRSMNLLSAGERTMAGLAFLFALGHAAEDRGLPLAVLDEVDAPLDEANIRRFTRFLQVFAARGAQFVLVTHQKATMEVATALWGVTTDASGASRVLSIKNASEAVS